MIFREQVYHILEGKDERFESISRSVNGFIIGLILLNLVAIICESSASIIEGREQFFQLFEIFSIVVFSLEYLGRVWIAPLRYPHLHPVVATFKYITSFFALVDLLAIIPFFLPLIFAADLRFMRALRLMRLLRLLKLSRYSQRMQLVGSVLREKRFELWITLIVTAVLLIVASIIMYFIEHDAQPDQFPNIFATFWWAVATLTTVGYGDVYPITAWGKFVSAIIALLGIGLVALPTGILSSTFIEALGKNKEEEKAEPGHDPAHFKYCPYCGKELDKHHHEEV